MASCCCGVVDRRLFVVLLLSTAGVLILTLINWPSEATLLFMSRPSLIRTEVPAFVGQWSSSSASAADTDMDSVASVGRVVDTPSCVVPDYDPYNPIISPMLKDPSPDEIWCNSSWPLVTYVTDGDWIRINATLRRRLGVRRCQYEQIARYDDYRVDYGDPVAFIDDVRPEADFVRVRCYGDNATRLYSNFHALIRRKGDVERRCDENLDKFLKSGMKSVDDVFNVLMMGVDSISRLNSMRRLNATRRFLLERMQAVELRGYGRVGDNSFPNILALLTGMYANERPAGSIDRAPLLWRPFSAAGYKTLYVEDGFIENHVFDIWVDALNSPRGFSAVPTDYYFRTMSVAQHGDNEAISRTHFGPACIGPVYETEYILDWMENFVKKANSKTKRRPYFSFGFFSRLTHDDQNQAAFIDLYLEAFFRRLDSVKLLANTAIVLFSDHGMRYGSTRGYTRMGWYEENTPMALIALPESFRRRHPAMYDSLRSNTGSLTTPMDLHETIRRLLTIERPYDELERRNSRRRGRSLFDGQIGDRSCEQASIAPVYCECLLSSTSALKTDSVEVRDVAEQTVAQMNVILGTYKGSCASLQLSHVIEARVTRQVSALNGQEFTYFTLTYQTTPGEGIFQAMVKRINSSSSSSSNHENRTSVDISGDVLRLNSHSKHSGCVHHIIHKKWCYCVLNSELDTGLDRRNDFD